MASDPEAAEIAARLSSAQKRALLNGYASNWPNRNWMVGAGLAEPTPWSGMGLTRTPLGLRVRAILAAEAADA